MAIRKLMCGDRRHLQVVIALGVAFAVAVAVAGLTSLCLDGARAALHDVDPADWDSSGSSAGLL